MEPDFPWIMLFTVPAMVVLKIVMLVANTVDHAAYRLLEAIRGQ